MDISLIKLVLLVVSPTPSLSPSLLSIFITILEMMWPSLVADVQSFTRILQKWHSIGIQHFKLEDSPLGGAETFLILGGFDSIPRLAPVSLRNVIQSMVDISNWKTMENQFDPMMSICHVFHHLDPAFTWSRHCPSMEHFSDTCLDLIQCCPKFGSCLDPQRDQKTMMLFMTVNYWIVFIGLDSSRKE